MHYKNVYKLIFLSLLFCNNVSSQKYNSSNYNTLTAQALKPYGRCFIDKEQNLELISSAVHFGFSFTGKECVIYASGNDAAGHNYLQYELDGVYQKRLKVAGD